MFDERLCSNKVINAGVGSPKPTCSLSVRKPRQLDQRV
jgi:hypothetical protein